MADFYLHDRALAGYVEKDWYDFIARGQTRFTTHFARFSGAELYGDYHERLIQFLGEKAGEIRPQNLLEVGSSLGRTYFEICRRYDSLRAATLVEPSQNLARGFKNIFIGESMANVPVLMGNSEIIEVRFDPSEIRDACKDVRLELIERPFQEVNLGKNKFDLVVCSNVIDQCRDPLKLGEFLKTRVTRGGVLLLSCTYQWSEKYVGNAGPEIKDITELFLSDWKLLGETNLPFRLRINERHWLSFLSHVVAYRAL